MTVMTLVALNFNITVNNQPEWMEEKAISRQNIFTVFLINFLILLDIYRKKCKKKILMFSKYLFISFQLFVSTHVLNIFTMSFVHLVSFFSLPMLLFIFLSFFVYI